MFSETLLLKFNTFHHRRV